ncbi:MAG: cobalamin-binding protein [bacterium]|nr:cobalamin-binding protein [bacterium]
MDLLQQLSKLVEKGDNKIIGEITNKAVAEGLPPQQIVNDGFIAGMDVVGERFRKHEVFLPDVLLAAKAMRVGMDIVEPLLKMDDVPVIGKVILGTVQGDLHDIGKNLVAVLLEGAGFKVIDLGNDVPPERFVEAALEEEADVIGMSTLLTTTMPMMKNVIDAVNESGLSEDVRTIIGGAPVSAEYAGEIGADAYGYDGANAVERIKALVGVG